MRKALSILGLLACLGLAACRCSDDQAPTGSRLSGSSAAKAIATKLSVGLAIPSYVHAVAWIGADRGFFRQHGLTTEVAVLGGSAATLRALIGNSIQVALAGGDAVLKATAAGAELVVVGGLVDRFYHRLVVRSEISDAAALKGKTIGLPFVGGPQDMAVRFALEQLKLRYGEDVKVVGLGREFNRLAALKKGAIQGTTSQAPTATLKRLGFRVLVDLPAQAAPFPYAVVVVQRALLREDPGAVRAFLSGLCQAIAYYKDPQNEAASLELIAKRLGTTGSDTAGARKERYAQTGPSLLSYPPLPNVKAFENVRQMLGKQKDPRLGPGRIFDLRILRELIQEGVCGSPSAPKAR